MNLGGLQPRGEREGGERVVITVAGENRPGIVAAFSKVLAQEEVDILDLTQRVVQGLFVMMIVADLGNARAQLLDLRERLTDLGGQQRLQVSVQHERLFRFIDRV